MSEDLRLERRLFVPIGLPSGAVIVAPSLTVEQREAVERRDGALFVRAGAGTGKTRVLVQRFLAALLDDGVTVDGILAITFTERAAAEMRSRVRSRLLDLGERELARQAESAAISTIHAFCARLLRANALESGLDPEFKVLDDVTAARLVIDAFDGAMEQFLEEARGTNELDLAATYGPDRLRSMVSTVHGRLRSRGQRRPALEPVEVEADASETDRKAAVDHALLARLLDLFAERYTRLKDDRSALDFDDLELCARDLLRTRPGLCAAVRGRFAHVMVDEFQDVNPVQEELLDLVSGGDLFAVGDEHQSIYGFRHADVEIFERRLAAAQEAERAVSLTTNFRSRPELLHAIDVAFASVWPDGRFEPLRPPADAAPQAARISPSVELLLVDRARGCWDELGEDPFGVTLGDVTVWRAAEARLLAERISELAGPGRAFGWDDVAVLVRSARDMHAYERALTERGIPAYAHGGRGFAEAQQVSDLRSYLAALANPLDELALVSVLASPLAGVSLGGIACLRLRARRLGRRLWHALEEAFMPGGDGSDGLAEAFSPGDRESLGSFCERFARQRRGCARLSLEALIDRVVVESGYDVSVLEMPAGDRRLANVRKLMRIARQFEAVEGRDIRGFIDHLDERRLLQSRESEAPLQGETSEPAVRVMTVHAAKGLEFPVVCVADLGRAARGDSGGLEVSEDGRTGLRLASLSGETQGALDWEQLKQEQAERGEQEERRIFYVAMTRAQEHLVLSGAVDAGKWPEPKPLAPPIDWIWRAIAPGAPEILERDCTGEEVRTFDGHEVRVACRLCSPASVDELLPPEVRVPRTDLPEAGELGEARARREFRAMPVPASLPVARLSYSALESYHRCGYRFYLERVARLRGPDAVPRVPPRAATNGQLLLDVDAAVPELEAEAQTASGVSALLRGTIVHELLERVDLAEPTVPDAAEIEASLRAHGAQADAYETAWISELVGAFLESHLCTRVRGAARVRKELAFSFELAPHGDAVRALLVNGVVDVLAEERDGVLVVDYKTDPLEGGDPASIVAGRYATQRLVYALAALRSGAPRVDVAYSFLEAAGDPVLASYEASDAAALERELLDLAGGVLAARFEPTDAPHRELCLTCPGRATLCSWGPEHTMRERPEPSLRS